MTVLVLTRAHTHSRAQTSKTHIRQIWTLEYFYVGAVSRCRVKQCSNKNDGANKFTQTTFTIHLLCLNYVFTRHAKSLLL